MKIIAHKTNNYLLLLITVAGLFIAGCKQQPGGTKPCGPCPEYAEMIPNLSFRVIDKNTMQNLFFGSGAPYTPSQLKFYHIINGKPDSLHFVTDTLDQYFNIAVMPAHRTDTVTMQIAGKPQDMLLFETVMVGQCCPRLTLASVLFNGTVVYTASTGPRVAVLQE